jgi:hypothetical protein
MTVTAKDYRRPDLRVNLNGDPSWLISNVIDGLGSSGLKDSACVLFSFPIDGQQIIIREIVVRIIQSFDVGVAFNLGRYTLATDDLALPDVATLVDVDAYVKSSDISPNSTGWYYPSSGEYVDAKSDGITSDGSNLIVGASTTVPAVVLTPSAATITTGRVQVLMLVCVVPIL